ncbi:hypothetical protein AGMMS50276_10100 [Synergistales bacterium]|nr:hypothetical protein AGMMS50276_10100 [Synergistales bacterium]
MPLVTCKLCNKLFTSGGPQICSSCLTKVDNLYPRVREFLRDNPKTEFNVDTVAHEMEEDIRYVQALVDMKYLDRDMETRVESPSTKARERLANELQKSLRDMKSAAAKREAAKDAAASYGQERHGGNKIKPQ